MSCFLRANHLQLHVAWPSADTLPKLFSESPLLFTASTMADELLPLQAEASAQLGVQLPRERSKQEYSQALVQRYQHLPEVKRIVRHKHLPKPIYKVREVSLDVWLASGGLPCLVLIWSPLTSIMVSWRLNP